MSVDEVRLSPSEAMRMLSEEIRHLHHRLARLEHGIEHVYACNGEPLGSVAVTALQELDMLAQSTDALAAYSEKLSRRLEDRTEIDLTREVSAIPLRALGQRLSGITHDDLTANAPELF
ncbi:chemotaxis protein [Salipiger bermudensis]|uniref:chemotaxis protein n=1 Tax=Salipiger bermudensis TaxID=344736 RepID=UPI001C99CDB9|nr:chemotaxis protein [Salipiger bermudensis]MBY6002455.1 chemotaxis protein [Salipiger bermudensis]